MHNHLRSRKAALWIGAFILLTAFALRAHRLAYDSVWWDEGFSVWMGRMPLAEMFFQTANDAHPPLSYAMLHGWIGLVGNTEFALRMQSVLFGMLTVALAYQIGRVAGGRSVGLAGALITALMRLPVWWSQEIRMYAPAALFAALALWAALILFTQSRRLWLWAILLAVSLGAGLLTLYLFAGVVLALNLAFIYAFVASPQRWKLAGLWIAAQVGALAMFIPWIRYALPYIPSWEAPQAPVTFLYVIKLYLSTVFLGIATDIERYLPLLVLASLLLIAAATFAFVRSPRQSRVVWVTLIIGTLLPPILVYLLSIPRGAGNYPTPSPRYFLLLSTPLYVLLGWGAVALRSKAPFSGMESGGGVRSLAPAMILLPLIAIAGWSLSDYYAGLHLTDDYQSIVATLQALRQPEDAVLINNDTDWPIFDYHYHAEFSRRIPHDQTVIDDKYAKTLLNRFRRDAGVWLIQTQYAEVTDPRNRLGKWLEDHSWNSQSYSFPGAQVWFFAMNGDRGLPSNLDTAQRWPDAFHRVEVSITDGVRVIGYTEPVPEVFDGDVLVVGLGWHLDQGVSGEWPVAVKLIGADGAEIASQPVTLTGTSDADHYLPIEVFIPSGAQGGRTQIVFAAGKTWQTLGSVLVRERARSQLEEAKIPSSANTLNIRFGSVITLAAVDLPNTATFHPGDNIALTLYWRADGYIPEHYKVFVHVRGEAYDPLDDSNIWGQQDQEPRNNSSPTTAWRPGQIIADDYLVPIKSYTLPGHYQIQVGLYQPLGGQRLPLFASDGTPMGDTATIFEIEITP